MVVDWLAERRGLQPGDSVEIRSNAYEVVGVYRAPDTPMVAAGLVPYETLNRDWLAPEIDRAQAFFRRLFENPLLAPFLPPTLDPGALDPVARQFALEQGAMFRIYEIVPVDRSREGTQALAKRLREVVPHLAVVDPQAIEDGMEEAVALFLAITLIVTAISTVVGGLLIVNTMAMAVIERRREIAIKAALGATPAQIAAEFVAEAALLALVGAALGVGLGVLAILIGEPLILAQVKTGAALFRLTPRLLLGAVAYALVMGVVAGGVPALRAARVDPAVSLRGL
jgi:putative ABC transport system permease protein